MNFTENNTFTSNLATTNANLYAESGETTRKTTQLFKCSDVGNHGGKENNVIFIESRPVGSGANGPSNADYGASISVVKQNYMTTAVQGEIDGLNISVRQGGVSGGTASDCAGILINVATADASGFAAATESVTSILSTVDGSVTKQVDCQVGILDDVRTNYIGFHTNALLGNLGNAFDARQSSGAWSNFLFYSNASGVPLFKVNGSGQIVLCAATGETPSKTIRALTGRLAIVNDAGTAEIFSLSDKGSLTLPGSLILVAPSGTAPSKTIRSLTGRLSIVNDAGTNEIFSLTDVGNLTLPGTLTLYNSTSTYPSKTIRSSEDKLSVLNNGGSEILTLNEAGLLTITNNINCGGVLVNGTMVVSTRVTGWAASTGAAQRGTYNANGYAFTASAIYAPSQIQTLSDGLTLALQQIKALKDDLIHHGLIGA